MFYNNYGTGYVTGLNSSLLKITKILRERMGANDRNVFP